MAVFQIGSNGTVGLHIHCHIGDGSKNTIQSELGGSDQKRRIPLKSKKMCSLPIGSWQLPIGLFTLLSLFMAAEHAQYSGTNWLGW